MKKIYRLPPLAAAALLGWLALSVSGCVTLVQAAGSPTPPPSPTPTETAAVQPAPTIVPTGTAAPLPSLTPLPRPVCTIEWAWRDAGLTITRVDFSRADGLAPGDLILTIDGRDAETVIAELETGLAGGGDPEMRRLLALDALLYGSDVLLLLVRHGQAPAYYYNLEPDCHL